MHTEIFKLNIYLILKILGNFLTLAVDCNMNTRGVSHYSLAIYIEKHLKEKEELWKLK
jgi:hypothetical protein